MFATIAVLVAVSTTQVQRDLPPAPSFGKEPVQSLKPVQAPVQKIAASPVQKKLAVQKSPAQKNVSARNTPKGPFRGAFAGTARFFESTRERIEERQDARLEARQQAREARAAARN